MTTLQVFCGVFTLTVTDTDRETETDEIRTEPSENRCWYLSSMNTSMCDFLLVSISGSLKTLLAVLKSHGFN